ncbi:hypothetical protein EV421DRAFT_1131022 [Armillaria borealis]|uniref:Uncharacterized protein n=1 Tax=Armillaria borealis TaxID=47425 RepID=A0AA39J519_9AGAR|nr:hypothetical protein EV421DRAFT_1131022 [Armillaria borealis]
MTLIFVLAAHSHGYTKRRRSQTPPRTLTTENFKSQAPGLQCLRLFSHSSCCDVEVIEPILALSSRSRLYGTRCLERVISFKWRPPCLLTYRRVGAFITGNTLPHGVTISSLRVPERLIGYVAAQQTSASVFVSSIHPVIRGYGNHGWSGILFVQSSLLDRPKSRLPAAQMILNYFLRLRSRLFVMTSVRRSLDRRGRGRGDFCCP